MLNSFEFIDIVIIIGICQGIFLIFSLLKISNTNKKANAILSYLLLIATLMLIGRFVFFRFFNEWVFQWSLLVDMVIFLFGPFVYSYSRRLLFKGDESYRLPKFHFIPAALFLITCGYYLFFYNPSAYYGLYQEGKLSLYFTLVTSSAILLNCYYVIQSFLLIRRYRAREKQAFSFDQSPINYLNYFLFAISFCLAVWLLNYINYKILNTHFTFINYDSVWVTISIFIYVIGYFSLKQPELFRIPLDLKNTEKRDRLSEADSNLLKSKLDHLIVSERLFLKSNLTLVEVAEKLHTSTNNLSWLLNNVYNCSFYDFINNHRIQEFVRKVEDEEHLLHTILALSLDVGFNSKSSFNKAFKLTMNETPSNYIKNHRAA